MRASCVAVEANLSFDGLPSKKENFSAQSPQAKIRSSLVCM